MIQFNLLPAIKQEYIKTKRIKRTVIAISCLASAAALFVLLVLLATVLVIQKKSIHDLNTDIQNSSKTLKDTPNLNNILTVQTQLNALTALHNQKPAASRLFGYLSQLTPSQITISDLLVDFGQNTVTVTGGAPNLATVNTFVDVLKFATYSVSGQSGSTNAFSTVVLGSFGVSTSSSSPANYSITMNFDPLIFNNANSVTLNVGNQPTSSPQQPSIIFVKGQ